LRGVKRGEVWSLITERESLLFGKYGGWKRSGTGEPVVWKMNTGADGRKMGCLKKREGIRRARG